MRNRAVSSQWSVVSCSVRHSQPSTLNSQPITRPGFTLIEVLVALGLTVVLLAAVYASINIWATSGLENSGGGISPLPSISRTFVPERNRWASES